MRRLFLVFLAICIGCGSIPDVVFVDDAVDSGADEGGLDEGGVLPEGGPAGYFTCSNPPPGGTCCGSSMCLGDCPKTGAECKQQCSKCSRDTDVCCRKSTGEVTCLPALISSPPVCP
jgi:hypothetical protein